jgi:pSer/pThr/pTyr-binding forkhead associated (FHA) protein
MRRIVPDLSKDGWDMQIKLKVLSGKSAGQILPVTADQFVVGRDEGCHLRPKSDAIAPKHCRIAKDQQGASIEDLGSASGTFVNNERITGKRELETGVRLRIGPLEFEIEIEYELGGKKREKVKDIADVAARTAGQQGDRDGDIDSWLTDDEDEAPTQENRVFSLDDIKVVKKEEEVSAQSDPKKKQPPAKKEYGKLPQRPQEATAAPKDTREAAADMLKKIFKNK